MPVNTWLISNDVVFLTFPCVSRALIPKVINYIFLLQRRPQHKESRLRGRLHILRINDDRATVNVIAFCSSQLWPILARRCHWRGCLSIFYDWTAPYWEPAGGIKSWDSTPELEGENKHKDACCAISNYISAPLQIKSQGRGELLISLCWQPAAGRLTVVLLKARNLPRMDVTGLADPYVKIYLLYNVSSPTRWSQLIF